MPRETASTSVIPTDHDAFHRSALGSNSADVLLALAHGPLRPKDLAPRLRWMSERTMYRALDKLEAHGIVTKTLLGEWSIATLAPLDLIARQAGLAARSTRLALANAQERDDHLARQGEAQIGQPTSAERGTAPLVEGARVPIDMSLAEALMATPHGPALSDTSVTEQRRATRRKRAEANERRSARRRVHRSQSKGTASQG